MSERCMLCGCRLHRSGRYAVGPEHRSHANEHHFVAERFFGRSKNRPGTVKERMLAECPWGQEHKTGIFCYDCGEILLHNPVLLGEDFERFANLIRARGLSEDTKERNYTKFTGRVALFHEIIARGIKTLCEEEQALARV
jgi:hypothetical protein